MNPPIIDLRDDSTSPFARLVIVVRADPVICGHAGEARNLAEAALARGIDDVHILTWPLDRLAESGLPLKPLDRVAPYGDGIHVERPDPVGDYRVPDGRWSAGLAGRLVELVADGRPTLVMSLYLEPHTSIVVDAVDSARRAGLDPDVTTIAEAVGSDVTNVVRSCLDEGRHGAAVRLLATYLANDHVVAVSDYTRQLIVESAERIDEVMGTQFASSCRRRVGVSYPAIATDEFTTTARRVKDEVLASRGLVDDGYVLSLCRLTPAKGLDDLIRAHAEAPAARRLTLVIAGRGPDGDRLRSLADELGTGDHVRFLDDVDDDEKAGLMAGARVYALPSKPRREFVETFGISAVEALLAGSGTVITTTTGGLPEAVGSAGVLIAPDDVAALTSALDSACADARLDDAPARARVARVQAGGFDRRLVFARLHDDAVKIRAGRRADLAA